MPKPKLQQKRQEIASASIAVDAGAVLAWYNRHARTLPWRVSPADRARGIRPDPYRVWLSEVMLQQTTVAAVQKYFLRFTTLWPTVADLAAAPLEAVLVEWAGLGYYARARNLHACAVAVVERHGGRFPVTAEGLLTLPGIGAYTSAAIAAIADDEPIAVLDGNVERVMARYLALDVPVRDAKELLRAEVQRAVPARSGDFAQAMMDLGATICTPRVALCMLCPLQPACLGTRTGNPEAFPVKPEKSLRPIRYGHAFVISDSDGDIYLRTRADTGLLAKMTETPGSAWSGEVSPPQFPFPGDWRQRGQVVHVFTHFRLELDVWSVTASAPEMLTKGWWADPRELDNEALPSLFRKVLAQAGIEAHPHP
ncbi:MAG TPA: A/G-specific adenine glycosylase [Devosiaceae bacterium]|jgi:A/G-specific adenine glycosylase